MNPHGLLHTPLKRARLPFRHYDKTNLFIFQFTSLSVWRSNRFAFALSSKDTQSFSSAECHYDKTNLFIFQFTSLKLLRKSKISTSPIDCLIVKVHHFADYRTGYRISLRQNQLIYFSIYIFEAPEEIKDFHVAYRLLNRQSSSLCRLSHRLSHFTTTKPTYLFFNLHL